MTNGQQCNEGRVVKGGLALGEAGMRGVGSPPGRGARAQEDKTACLGCRGAKCTGG